MLLFIFIISFIDKAHYKARNAGDIGKIQFNIKRKSSEFRANKNEFLSIYHLYHFALLIKLYVRELNKNVGLIIFVKIKKFLLLLKGNKTLNNENDINKPCSYSYATDVTCSKNRITSDNFSKRNANPRATTYANASSNSFVKEIFMNPYSSNSEKCENVSNYNPFTANNNNNRSNVNKNNYFINIKSGENINFINNEAKGSSKCNNNNENNKNSDPKILNFSQETVKCLESFDEFLNNCENFSNEDFLRNNNTFNEENKSTNKFFKGNNLTNAPKPPKSISVNNLIFNNKNSNINIKFGENFGKEKISALKQNQNLLIDNNYNSNKTKQNLSSLNYSNSPAQNQLDYSDFVVEINQINKQNKIIDLSKPDFKNLHNNSAHDLLDDEDLEQILLTCQDEHLQQTLKISKSSGQNTK